MFVTRQWLDTGLALVTDLWVTIIRIYKQLHSNKYL
jgi:hypothetical protein